MVFNCQFYYLLDHIYVCIKDFALVLVVKLVVPVFVSYDGVSVSVNEHFGPLCDLTLDLSFNTKFFVRLLAYKNENGVVVMLKKFF